jgi:hypothetical protein
VTGREAATRAAKVSTPLEASPPATWGSWEDADALRKWAFLQRTPEQRLQWLIEMLEIAYASGARQRPGRPDADADPPAP